MSGKPILDPALPGKCQAKFEKLIGPMRTRAAACGYAIAVHGSLARDIDLIAVPWVEQAVPPMEFVAAMIEIINEVNGCAYVRNDENADPFDFTRRNPQLKPHGRLAWSIHLGGGPYIDLSVMPHACHMEK